MQYVSSSRAGCQPTIVAMGRDGWRATMMAVRPFDGAQYCRATARECSSDETTNRRVAPKTNGFEVDKACTAGILLKVPSRAVVLSLFSLYCDLRKY